MEVSETRKAERCPVCKKGRVVTDASTLENICDHCGSVVSVRRETLQPEWREFEAAPSRERVGPPVTLTKSDMGLATYLSKTYKKRAKRTAAEKKRIERIRRLQRRILFYKPRQRSLAKAANLMTKLIDTLHLPRSVAEDASYIYRKALDKRLIKGRTIVAMVAASLYAACRNFGVHRTLEDMATASGVGKERIARNYRLLVEELGLETALVDPAKALSSIAAKLSVSEQIMRKALEMVRKAQESSIAAGKNPIALAAAALYIACIAAKEKRTQKAVAKAAGISDVTLRTRSEEIKKLKHKS